MEPKTEEMPSLESVALDLFRKECRQWFEILQQPNGVCGYFKAGPVSRFERIGLVPKVALTFADTTADFANVTADHVAVETLRLYSRQTTPAERVNLLHLMLKSLAKEIVLPVARLLSECRKSTERSVCVLLQSSESGRLWTASAKFNA